MFKIIAAAVSVVVLIPATAYADVVGCSGQVRGVEMRANGLVIGDWGYGYKGLCYVNQDTNVNGVLTLKETCGTYYAALLTAKASRAQIVSYHYASTCAFALAETDGGSHWVAIPPYSIVLTDN